MNFRRLKIFHTKFLLKKKVIQTGWSLLGISQKDNFNDNPIKSSPHATLIII